MINLKLFLLTAILSITALSFGASPNETGQFKDVQNENNEFISSLEAFDILFNVNNDVSQVFQWRPGSEVEERYSDFNFSSLLNTYCAWMEEDIERTFVFHTFSINKNGKHFYNDDWREFSFPRKIKFANVAGKYDIMWFNNLPVKFTMDNSALQEDLANDEFDFNNYLLGFEWFTISYDNKGMPLKLVGKLLPQYHNGDFYTELYSDYIFNENGKWVKRKVTQSYGLGSEVFDKRTDNEYRCYIAQ